MCWGLLRGSQATAEFHGTSWPWVSMDWSIPCNCTKSWQLPQWAMACNCHSLATHRKEEELLIKHWTLLKPALTSVPSFLIMIPLQTFLACFVYRPIESPVITILVSIKFALAPESGFPLSLCLERFVTAPVSCLRFGCNNHPEKKHDKPTWLWFWELQPSVDFRFRRKEVIWERLHLENIIKMYSKAFKSFKSESY